MEIQESAEGASSNHQFGDNNNVDPNSPWVPDHSHWEYEYGSIFRAPTALRLANPHSFGPLVVSIGPYNRGKQAELAIKDRDKLMFVYDLLGESEAEAVEELAREMMDMVPRARKCYSEGFDEISDSEFAKMMVVDGCFIIRVLSFVRPEILRNQVPALPIMKGERWVLPSIRLDLIKVENQIPFFVLQTLQESLTKRGNQTLPPVYDLALDFLRPLMAAAKTPARDPGTLCVHLLSLFHIMLLPKVPEPRINVINYLGARSRGHSVVRACRIWSRGIILKVNEDISMDVAYHHGILEAPCFTIDQNTETVLRNLLAYEQGNRLVECCTTAFVSFINALVDTSNDVAFLRKKGMLSHTLGSDAEATALINSLNIGVPHNEFECFLCKLDGNIKPTYYRLIRAIMSFSEFIIFAVMPPSSFVTAILALFAVYLSITQTILTVFTLK